MTNNFSFSVRFTDEFEKQLYKLSKKYRNIRKDIEPVIKQIEEGIFLEDRLSGFGANIYIYKVRVKIVIQKKVKVLVIV